MITNWRLMLGIAFYLFSSVLFVLGVRKGELSVLYPMVSLGSVWTLFWSRLVLGEPFTRAEVRGAGDDPVRNRAAGAGHAVARQNLLFNVAVGEVAIVLFAGILDQLLARASCA